MRTLWASVGWVRLSFLLRDFVAAGAGKGNEKVERGGCADDSPGDDVSSSEVAGLRVEQKSSMA